MEAAFDSLSSRRSGDRIGFDRLAERLQAYVRAHPEDAEAVTRLASYLTYVETEDQLLFDKAVADTFPASDTPSHSAPATT